MNYYQSLHRPHAHALLVLLYDLPHPLAVDHREPLDLENFAQEIDDAVHARVGFATVDDAFLQPVVVDSIQLRNCNAGMRERSH